MKQKSLASPPGFNVVKFFLAYCLRMTFSDLASPAEADFTKAGNRYPFFGVMRGRQAGCKLPAACLPRSVTISKLSF
jgi:hypothetical protein